MPSKNDITARPCCQTVAHESVDFECSSLVSLTFIKFFIAVKELL